jgi:predicted ATP-grasp superfamily ATP-dependent carboligase
MELDVKNTKGENMLDQKRAPIVVTCCHTRVGYNVACGLVRAGWKVVATGRATPSMCAHIDGVVGDYAYQDPFQHPQEYLQVLRQAARSHGAQIILPVHEDIFVASRFVEALEPTAKVLVPKFDELLSVHDKGLVPKYAELANIPTPRTLPLHSRKDVEHAIEEIGLPCLIKPRLGSGAQGIVTFKTVEDLDWLRQLSDEELEKDPCVLQEWVEGIGAVVIE